MGKEAKELREELHKRIDALEQCRIAQKERDSALRKLQQAQEKFDRDLCSEQIKCVRDINRAAEKCERDLAHEKDNYERDQKYKCAICFNPYMDPVRLNGCGHVYCRACITANAQHNGHKCANCRAQYTGLQNVFLS